MRSSMAALATSLGRVRSTTTSERAVSWYRPRRVAIVASPLLRLRTVMQMWSSGALRLSSRCTSSSPMPLSREESNAS